MREIALHLLDIAKNAVEADATCLRITLRETDDRLTMIVEDDGCGMEPEFAARAVDPFTTTRTTRRIGMGLPLLRLAAELTGGHMEISSRYKEQYPEQHGTRVSATFCTLHIDCPPVGDIPSTLWTLVQGSPHVDLVFLHEAPGRVVQLDTREIRAALGEGIPLSEPAVLAWLGTYLREQYGQPCVSQPMDRTM